MQVELKHNNLLKNFDGKSLHPKNKILKDQLLEAEHWICMERAKFYTESYKETEGEYPTIRSAKALRHTFNNMTVKIFPHELLVGNRSSKLIAPPIAPERGDMPFVIETMLPVLKKRQGYHITKEHKTWLSKDIIPYWEDKSVRSQKVKRFEEAGLASQLSLGNGGIKRLRKAFGFKNITRLVIDPTASLWDKIKFIFKLPTWIKAIKNGTADNILGRGRCIDTQAHIVPGHKNVLKKGFKGIKDEAQQRLETATTEEEKGFLQGVIIACEAIREFSLRFSELAKNMANTENNEERKEELGRIAELCKKVPWNPPESFYEAVQTMWFTQNAIIISYGAGSGITPGRVDQLLYPFYKKDIENDRITNKRALRLIEEFIIKINNNVVIWPNILGIRLNHLGSDIENITIGGVTPEGKDATNELSYLFIEAIKNTKLATSASFRFSEKSPKQFKKSVIEIHKHTNSPALFNDEILIKALERDGYTTEAARDYCLVGCVEPSGNGDTFGATGGSKLYFPSILDLVLNRGKTTFFGTQDTEDTGDPTEFETFDEFMDVYYTQLEQIVDAVAEATILRDEIWANNYHKPLISCTIDGCIDNAKDATQGGSIYKFQAIGAGGLGTVVDSLAAIKKFVYDEKKVTMQELVNALHTNFKDKEELRQMLKNGAKFGNDNEYVDKIAVELTDKFCDMVSAKQLPNGGHFKPSFISYGLNVYEGALEPATPNGRKAGEPLSNSISPSNGAEQNGPTAALNSVAKIDHTKIGYGDSLNLRFPHFLVKDEKGREIFQSLMEGYFAKGGMHMQTITYGTEMLKDAQENPEQYEDLIVRVSGYAAYFTRLGKSIQDDIIERTEFSNLSCGL
ncbi:MAG: pyruvate formate lyase family protein [Promethearchaeia archaeon]